MRGRTGAVIFLALCACVGKGMMAAAAPLPRVVPAQRLETVPPQGQALLSSEHFDLRYDPNRINSDQAEQARRLSEAGWEHCRQRFGGAFAGRISLDLSPRFYGATGFARSGDPDARKLEDRPTIGVRYADLEYLGLPPEYVLTHEIGHLYSGEAASTSLGEGIADWAAGGFAGIPLRQGWGNAMKAAGLWLDPDGLFITGELPASGEVDAQIRTAQYAQSALLVQYLVGKSDWPRFKAFALEYGKARGPLESNADRRQRPQGRFGPRRDEQNPTRPPDPELIRALFRKHFGQTWEELRADWLHQVAADMMPTPEAARLTLGQRLYGAIRNWEMWVLDQRTPPLPGIRDQVRALFTEANRKLREGDLPAAERSLARARAMVDGLRRPREIVGLPAATQEALPWKQRVTLTGLPSSNFRSLLAQALPVWPESQTGRQG